MRPATSLVRGTRALSTRAGPLALGQSSRPLVHPVSISTPATASAAPLLARARARTPSAVASASVPAARTFFSLPDISKLTSSLPTPGGDADEQRFNARKIMPYTPAQLYELVSDVPAYSYFLPFCTGSTVLDAAGRPAANWKPGTEPFVVNAELAVGFGGLEERYISRVVGVPFESVSATASKSSPLFKNLVSTWSFKPTTPTLPGQPAVGPTLLTIDLVFAFANPLHRIASQAVFPKVADKMVEAFESRAREVYGGAR